MTDVMIDKQKIDLLANAISVKSGEPVTMTLDEMVEAVDGIEPDLQDKTAVLSSAKQVIEADSGYDGLSSVTAMVPLQSRSYTVASSGYGTVTPDSGFIGLSQVAVNVGAATIPETTSNSASGTRRTTIAPSTSTRYINLKKGYINTNYYYQLTAMPSMTLPSAASSTSSGTKKAEVTPSSSVQYLNIPTGYNSSAAYYQINAASAQQTQTKTATPTESQQLIEPDSGYLLSSVTVNAISGSYVGSGIARRDSTDLSASGATVSVPAGYYASNASKAVSSGTEGTPTATKGNVSNHSVSVTPSVTNTAGYITGGTHTGTAVSVQASELVSGTYTVSGSGTADVTNYASASVAAGSATASATKGTVSNHAISVTPSVTRTAGWVAAGTSSGTAVSVSASELVSGSQTITQNGTVDVTNLASVTVNVSGGSSGMQVGYIGGTSGNANGYISFDGLQGEPTSFVAIYNGSIATGSPAKVAAVVFDGTDLHGQTIANTSNAQVSYDTGFSKTYTDGTLYISATNSQFAPISTSDYYLIYTYGGTSANIGTSNVQVGSGATSITFTGLPDEPDYWSCIFKSNFGTSSGYQRVIAVANDGSDNAGLEMDSGAHWSDAHWTASYSNGSLTITSQGTNAGGYFHQPGYYQLTYGIGGEVEPPTIEPLTVTQNGTYAESGKAYSPVTVNVSGGGSWSVKQETWTNNSTSTVSHQFTGLSGTPKAAVLRCTSQLTRSSSNTYYYIADIIWDGTDAWGNYHLRSNGTFNNVAKDAASGFNVSTGTNSITFSSDAASRSSAPGSFYNGTYELTYWY